MTGLWFEVLYHFVYKLVWCVPVCTLQNVSMYKRYLFTALKPLHQQPPKSPPINSAWMHTRFHVISPNIMKLQQNILWCSSGNAHTAYTLRLHSTENICCDIAVLSDSSHAPPTPTRRVSTLSNGQDTFQTCTSCQKSDFFRPLRGQVGQPSSLSD